MATRFGVLQCGFIIDLCMQTEDIKGSKGVEQMEKRVQDSVRGSCSAWLTRSREMRANIYVTLCERRI